jgi:hypothetical protein
MPVRKMIKFKGVTAVLSLFLTIGMNAQSPNWLWVKSEGGILEEDINGISADANANVYITGYYTSKSIAFGNITLSNADSAGNTTDIFVSKYDSAGNFLWAKSIGGSGDERSWSIYTDAKSNVYVAGNFNSDRLSFGNIVLSNIGGVDFFLAKYDSSGNLIWAKMAGGMGADMGWGICADTKGNAYVIGRFASAAIAFDSIPLTNAGAAGTFDIFVAKYSASGKVLWAKSAGGAYDDWGYSIGVDANGNAYTTGFFKSPGVTFGNCTLINSDTVRGTADIFITKYDPTGKVLWAQSAGGADSENGQSISLDGSGNAYVTGGFDSKTLAFPTATLTNQGSSDFFIAKYSPLGKFLWAKGAGGGDQDWGHSICTDAKGNSCITGGIFSPAIIFDTDTIKHTGERSIIPIIKYDTNGKMVWAKAINDNGTDGEGRGLYMDAMGKILLAGTFFNTITAEPILNNCDSTGKTADIFFGKLK